MSKSKKNERLFHLLIKGQFRVWCRPNNPVGNFNVTTLPSKANCANCLTAMRGAKSGNYRQFKVAHTQGRRLRHYDDVE